MNEAVRPRRRRRRGRRRKDGDDRANAASAALAAAEADAADAAVAVIEGPALDLAAPADQPLTEDEVAEALKHLAFVGRYRRVLRLRLNDSENLLVDGARAPEHRGQLKHLLAKVDKAAVVSAMGRKPVSDDRRAKANLLEGVARISGDLDVLLMWLEALAGSAGGRPAAAAFGAAVERIEFDDLSASRTDRLLLALEATFQGHERVLALFGLLENVSFRRAFDAASSELQSGGAAGRLSPLAAVHKAFVVKAGRGDAVEAGLETMLAAPASVLTAYRPAVREALAEAAARRGGPVEAVETLLKSLQQDSKAFQQVAWQWAGEQVRKGREAAAVKLLRKVRGAEAAALAEALEAPRVGPYALVTPDDDLDRVGMREAYDLRRQRVVLLRLGAPSDSAAVIAEGRLQSALCLPGVAVARDSGMGDRGTPYVAMNAGPGPLGDRLKALPPEEALRMAWDGVAILHALAVVGVMLPSISPSRFGRLAAGALELVDLSGAQEARVADALEAHRALAVEWVARAVAWPPLADGARPRRETPKAVLGLLSGEAPPDFSGWVALLE